MRKIVFLILSSFSFIFGMKQHKVSALDDLPQHLVNIVLRLQKQPAFKRKGSKFQKSKVLSLSTNDDMRLSEIFAKNALKELGNKAHHLRGISFPVDYNDKSLGEYALELDCRNSSNLATKQEMLSAFNNIIKKIREDWVSCSCEDFLPEYGQSKKMEQDLSCENKEDYFYFKKQLTKLYKKDFSTGCYGEAVAIRFLVTKIFKKEKYLHREIECSGRWEFPYEVYLTIKKDILGKFQQKMQFLLSGEVLTQSIIEEYPHSIFKALHAELSQCAEHIADSEFCLYEEEFIKKFPLVCKCWQKLSNEQRKGIRKYIKNKENGDR